MSHGVVQFVTYDEMKRFYCNYYNIPISSKLVSKWCSGVYCQSTSVCIMCTWVFSVYLSLLYVSVAYMYKVNSCHSKHYREPLIIFSWHPSLKWSP